jgi:eukaryotic-like serine/threonine-protein kinase
LQEKLDEAGPFDPADVVRLGQQIALGLAAAHDMGLIHRDIKPANILLEDLLPPRIKLTDFGLARTSDDASLTQSGVLVGTPMYMAPEQATGGPLTTQADLFSLGSVMYTMVSGRPPFRAPTSAAVLSRVVADSPRPIEEIIPNTPDGLCDVISRLLQKKPTDRYSSARAAAEAISHCLTEPVSLPSRLQGTLWIAASVCAAVVLLLVAVGFINQRFVFHGDRMAKGDIAFPIEAANQSDLKPEIDRLIDLPSQAEERWKAAVSLMAPEDRVLAVAARLKQLNPGLAEGFYRYRMNNDVVQEFRLLSFEKTMDFSPLSGLPEVKQLALDSNGFSRVEVLEGLKMQTLSMSFCNFTDLTPLAGAGIRELWLWGNQLTDLSPIKGTLLTKANLGHSPLNDISPLHGMPLEYLCLNFSRVTDLTPLEGAPLRVLECENVPVRDIGPLAKLPLEELYLGGCRIDDFGPIRNLKLKKITLDYQPELHLELLRSIPTLEWINRKPPNEILVDVDK